MYMDQFIFMEQRQKLALVYRHFLLFCLKGALAVGILSSTGITITQIIVGDKYYLGLAMSLYICFIGGLFGLMAAIVGFCILFPMRRSSQFTRISVGIGIALAIPFTNCHLSLRDWHLLDLAFSILAFPIMPAVFAVMYFVYLAKKHIRGANLSR